jgi:hypothetical protein
MLLEHLEAFTEDLIRVIPRDDPLFIVESITVSHPDYVDEDCEGEQ